MDEEFDQFCAACNAVLKPAQLYSHMSIEKDLQEGCRADIERLLVRAEELKAPFIDAGDERLANAMLGVSLMLEAQRDFLSTFISFKDGNASVAWDKLVNAQLSAHHAMKTADAVNNPQTFLQGVLMAEKVLFPPQTFMSIGAVAESTQCSICGNDYEECEHIVGRPYMGQLCSRIILKARLEEVSFVEEPANKHCRNISFRDGEFECDLLTRRMTRVEPGESAVKAAN